MDLIASLLWRDLEQLSQVLNSLELGPLRVNSQFSLLLCNGFCFSFYVRLLFETVSGVG